jgi:penicillin-binding protein 1B
MRNQASQWMEELLNQAVAGARYLHMQLSRVRWRPVLLSLFGVIVGLCIFEYVRLGRMIDRRLAEGPFSGSNNILASAETISVGESLTAEELTHKLERAGFNHTQDNPGGWLQVQGQVVQIDPPADSQSFRVRVDCAGGKIASIVSVESHSTIQEYRLPPQLITNLSSAREKRRLVRYADLPPSLVHALTSVEDKRFFQHSGFDYRRIAKAAWVDLKGGKKQEGASTLTMQLARSLWLDPGKSWHRKFEEFLITLHLEHELSKEQIFEDYANEIYLGRRGTFSINGFGEGARAFFGKELWQIDTSEAATLAGLVRRPSYYTPLRYPDRARSRRNLVLALMLRNHMLADADYHRAVAEPVRVAAPTADDSANSYFISMMNDEIQNRLGDTTKHSREIVTTLDPNLQRAAESAVRLGMDNVDKQLRQQNPHAHLPSGEPQVALVALDPRTGEIKALVGGRNYAVSQLNHAVAMRQPGSVFKPFVYAAAIDTAVEGGSRTFTPATILNDQATTFYFGHDVYQPKDYHGDYQGEVMLRTALAYSLNVATVSLAQQVGYQRVVNIARRAGLNDNIKATPSVALGAYETTPLEIAAAYTAFANGGMYVRPTTIASVTGTDGSVLYQRQTEPRSALDPRVAFVMTNLMQEVLNSGTGAGVRSQGFWLPAAGKTGTSRDGWFAGFTTELLCVVWVGFDDNRELNLEGARSALPIWAEFMKQASQYPPYSSAHQFNVPSGVSSAQICGDSGELATPECPNARTEVFIAGTEPSSFCHLHGVAARQ